ncbi:uncharacterized protein LOC134282092 [Saccostrea cucullata]|uniref:uncharacterized protein LOC134282092 n=1 Tax=Saccostrea cuccullata TaxID=36930 RepID=UPI002ECFDDCB
MSNNLIMLISCQWIFIILTCYLMYGIMSVTNAADSCETTRRTVVRVNKCPENKVEWMEASHKKNCSALAGLCSEPKRFVYHCVLNPFVNETLEVCAYSRKIFLGRCTEYTVRGNLIQGSRELCVSFPTSCPKIYASTNAYRYQECYKLVQRPTTSPTTAINTLMPSVVSKEVPLNISKSLYRITSINRDITMATVKINRDRVENDDNSEIIIIVCCASVLLLVLTSSFLLWKKRCPKQHDGTCISSKEIQLEPKESDLNECSELMLNGTVKNWSIKNNPG